MEEGHPPSNYVLIKASGNDKIVIEDSIYCVDKKAVDFAVPAVLPCVWIGEPNKRPYFAEGYKVPPEKTQSHLKSQFPPEVTLLKSQQNFQTCPKSNFLFTSISNIYFKRFSR